MVESAKAKVLECIPEGPITKRPDGKFRQGVRYRIEGRPDETGGVSATRKKDVPGLVESAMKKAGSGAMNAIIHDGAVVGYETTYSLR